MIEGGGREGGRGEKGGGSVTLTRVSIALPTFKSLPLSHKHLTFDNKTRILLVGKTEENILVNVVDMIVII